MSRNLANPNKSAKPNKARAAMLAAQAAALAAQRIPHMDQDPIDPADPSAVTIIDETPAAEPAGPAEDAVNAAVNNKKKKIVKKAADEAASDTAAPDKKALKKKKADKASDKADKASDKAVKKTKKVAKKPKAKLPARGSDLAKYRSFASCARLCLLPSAQAGPAAYSLVNGGRTLSIASSDPARCDFEAVFPESVAQEELHGLYSASYVQGLFEGVSSHVLLVGAPATGKTYTLFGGESFSERGLLTHCLSDVFDRVAAAAFRFDEQPVALSCLIVRNGTAYDLLDRTIPSVPSSEWQQLVDYSALPRQRVANEDDALALLMLAEMNRSIMKEPLSSEDEHGAAWLDVVFEVALFRGGEEAPGSVLRFVKLHGGPRASSEDGQSAYLDQLISRLEHPDLTLPKDPVSSVVEAIARDCEAAKNPQRICLFATLSAAPADVEESAVTCQEAARVRLALSKLFTSESEPPAPSAVDVAKTAKPRLKAAKATKEKEAAAISVPATTMPTLPGDSKASPPPPTLTLALGPVPPPAAEEESKNEQREEAEPKEEATEAAPNAMLAAAAAAAAAVRARPNRTGPASDSDDELELAAKPAQPQPATQSTAAPSASPSPAPAAAPTASPAPAKSPSPSPASPAETKLHRTKSNGRAPSVNVSYLVDVYINDDTEDAVLPINSSDDAQVQAAFGELRKHVMRNADMAAKCIKTAADLEASQAEVKRLIGQLDQERQQNAQRVLEAERKERDREREAKEAVEAFKRGLSSGAPMLKHVPRGSPHQRTFSLKGDRLVWSDGKKGVSLGEVVAIFEGRKTPQLERVPAAQEGLCFAVLTPSYALSLQASSDQERKLWVTGLSAMCPNAAVKLLGAR